jgi:hypothetical protein
MQYDGVETGGAAERGGQQARAAQSMMARIIQIPIVASDTTITSRSILSHWGMRFGGSWVIACSLWRPVTLPERLHQILLLRANDLLIGDRVSVRFGTGNRTNVRRRNVVPLALMRIETAGQHASSTSSATMMVTTAMKIATSTLDMRHIAHRHCVPDRIKPRITHHNFVPIRNATRKNAD